MAFGPNLACLYKESSVETRPCLMQHTAYGYCHTAKADLSGSNRDLCPRRQKYLLSGPLRKMFVKDHT